MTQITIDFSSDENRAIEIFKAQEGLKNKRMAVRIIVQKFFGLNEKYEGGVKK